MKTIVLGMDGSEGSKGALPVAVKLAREGYARLVIAYVDERIAARATCPRCERTQRRYVRDRALGRSEHR